MKILLIILALAVILVGVLIGGIKYISERDDSLGMTKEEETIKQDLPVRKPAVAGAFYPEDRDELSKMIRHYLDEALVDTNQKVGPRILIVPHAGYVYSGQAAAYGFLMLAGRAYKKVILIGPSHTISLAGISVFPKGYYETPLGKVEVDEELAREIIESSERISYIPAAHFGEHSLEVQLPFLQVVLNGELKTNNFKIVPILISFDSKENIEALVGALKDQVDEETLIVVSSDLSHYPEYEVANQVDGKFIEAVLTKKVDELDQAASESMSRADDQLETVACGRAGIKVGMKLAEAWNLEAQLLKYMNSGDVSGDRGRVVGYASIVFSKGYQREEETKKLEIRDVDLSEEDKQRLLLIARGALEEILGVNRVNKVNKVNNNVDDKETEKLRNSPDEIVPSAISRGKEIKGTDDTNVEAEALMRKLGAFVTLRRKDTGELRGCIGRFSPTDIPLYQVVQQMAIAAATEDIRFEPVSYDELDDIEIEISVLSELKKIDDWQEIELGKHGVEVVQGSRKGVFLPQVARENNWDLETFMNELCEHKAGVAREAWKTGEVDIYVFTAEVFGE